MARSVLSEPSSSAMVTRVRERYELQRNVEDHEGRVSVLEALLPLANPAVGVAAGYKIARGEIALDGSNPTPVPTGLTTVIAFVATLKGSVAPGVGTSVLTAVIGVAGSVDVHAWKPTSNADPTLVASTGTDTFYWVAIGT